MSGLLCVIPAIDEERTKQCLGSIVRNDSSAGINLADVLVVDNSRGGMEFYSGNHQVHRDPDGHNLGVARSWNIGARAVLAGGLDYLLIMSSSMIFGPELHCTWRWQMDQFWGADIIEADGHSWHLVAIHRRLFELVGLFDPNFYPGYFEQIDWCTRLRMIGREGAWPRPWVNALSTTVGAHSDLVLAPPLLDYYRDKWCGDKGEELHRLPWGDKPMGYFEEVPIPELAARYGLGPRGERWW